MMHHSPSRRAFSLTELLVVIGLIALLAAVLLVSMRSLRQAAARTQSLSALRQLSMAFKMYSEDDNDYKLMPGYVGTAQLGAFAAAGTPLEARLPNGTILDPEDTQSYVWRLAPYLDDTWRILYTDLRNSALVDQLEAEYVDDVFGPADAGANELGIAETPAYGFNSIFVGGDTVHGGGVTAFHPWNLLGNPPIAATRYSQVKNPSRLILFAPVAPANGGGATLSEAYANPGIGYCELRPPCLTKNAAGVWGNRQWRVGPGGGVELTATGSYEPSAGIPICRTTRDLLPLAHMDGSTTAESLADLSRDMSRWNPFEIDLKAPTEP